MIDLFEYFEEKLIYEEIVEIKDFLSENPSGIGWVRLKKHFEKNILVSLAIIDLENKKIAIK